MEPAWVESKWSTEELKGKSVRFRLRQKRKASGETVAVEGTGKIDAIRRDDRLIRIDVVVEQYPSPDTGVVTRFHLPQEAEPWIRKCSDGKVDFEIIDPSISV